MTFIFLESSDLQESEPLEGLPLNPSDFISVCIILAARACNWSLICAVSAGNGIGNDYTEFGFCIFKLSCLVFAEYTAKFGRKTSTTESFIEFDFYFWFTRKLPGCMLWICSAVIVAKRSPGIFGGNCILIAGYGYGRCG